MPSSPSTATAPSRSTAARSISAPACASPCRQIVGRGARRSGRAHQADRRRHRADARPGPHRRLERHPARRRADPPGRGDRAQGADRACGAEAERAGRRSRPPPTARCARKAGGAGVKFADLLAGNKFDLELDPKAPLKDPRTYTIVGKSLPRPDVPAKVTGSHRLRARLQRAGHAARPGHPAAGGRRRAACRSTNRRSRTCPASRWCGSRTSSAWSPRTSGPACAPCAR